MNEQNMISEELDHAGEVSTVTPSLLELDGYRITSETDVPSEEFLFRMFGKPCFPRRDLSAIMGVEKCGVIDAKAYYAYFGLAEEQGLIRKQVHSVTGVTWVELLDNSIPF